MPIKLNAEEFHRFINEEGDGYRARRICNAEGASKVSSLKNMLNFACTADKKSPNSNYVAIFATGESFEEDDEPEYIVSLRDFATVCAKRLGIAVAAERPVREVSRPVAVASAAPSRNVVGIKRDVVATPAQAPAASPVNSLLGVMLLSSLMGGGKKKSGSPDPADPAERPEEVSRPASK